VTTLGANQYGKSRVRLIKVDRQASPHRVSEWNVDLWLTGDFTSCFRDGDNSLVLPTDTMKNTVYSLARDSAAPQIEAFATEVVTYLVNNNPQIEGAGAHIKSLHWKPIDIAGHPQESALIQTGSDVDTCTVTYSRGAAMTMVSGLEGVTILKTAHSAFSGFKRDKLTTLRPSEDRLLGTNMTAEWQHIGVSPSFDNVRARIREALLATFSSHHSKSVQQTLFAMAEAALAAAPEISKIRLSMPNKHCNLVDLSPFGQDNPNIIFVPVDEPHGSIEATVRRTD
jgi:urate oxidase